MPDMEVHAEEGWLPSNLSILSDDSTVRDAKSRFTYGLIEAVGGFAATAVNEVDGTDYGPDQIVVLPFSIHLWANNAPTFLIFLEPDDVDTNLTPAQERERRTDIELGLRVSVAAHFQKHLPASLRRFNPKFDVEVRPIGTTGSSYTVKTGGIGDTVVTEVDHWGRAD